MAEIDWTASSARTYEFYEVDPVSWADVRKLDSVLSASMTLDREQETFGSGQLELTEEIGERYVRAYAVVEQGGARAKMPVATVLCQSASGSFSGAASTWPVQAYTPMLELAEDKPPIGHFVDKGTDPSKALNDVLALHCRAPRSVPPSAQPLAEDLCAEMDESWLSFASALAAKCGCYLSVDPYGRIVAVPERDPSAMQPVQRFGEDNATVVGEVTLETDAYGRCNVYESVLTMADGTSITCTERNDNPASPLSTASRGRTVLTRDTSPDVPDGLTAEMAQAHLESYTRRRMSEEAAGEHSVTYRHQWMPHVQVGSCVLLDFPHLGVRSRAVVSSQSTSCDTGGLVTETAKFTEVSAWAR